jgi:hypothetical protein
MITEGWQTPYGCKEFGWQYNYIVWPVEFSNIIKTVEWQHIYKNGLLKSLNM